MTEKKVSEKIEEVGEEVSNTLDTFISYGGKVAPKLVLAGGVIILIFQAFNSAISKVAEKVIEELKSYNIVEISPNKKGVEKTFVIRGKEK